MQHETTALEAKIRAAQTGPEIRLCADHVDQAIARVETHTFAGSNLTVCAITLRNGFTVTGEAACADPRHFNQEIGRRIAEGKAREKVFAALSLLVCENLAGGNGLRAILYPDAAQACPEREAIKAAAAALGFEG